MNKFDPSEADFDVERCVYDPAYRRRILDWLAGRRPKPAEVDLSPPPPPAPRDKSIR
jgi:hypothetical protein